MFKKFMAVILIALLIPSIIVFANTAEDQANELGTAGNFLEAQGWDNDSPSAFIMARTMFLLPLLENIYRDVNFTVSLYDAFFSYFPMVAQRIFTFGEAAAYVPELSIIQYIGDFNLRLVMFEGPGFVMPCEWNVYFEANRRLPVPSPDTLIIPADNFGFFSDDFGHDLSITLWSDYSNSFRRGYRLTPIEGLDGFYVVRPRISNPVTDALPNEVNAFVFINDDIELLVRFGHATWFPQTYINLNRSIYVITNDTIADFIHSLNFNEFISAFIAFDAVR
ncbi:MAG: hypothetical protein FWC95_04015 [Defluviitaleaceae bacterium]|nr:hypothetical protein [Defluviitaleaceae bacterium]